MLFWRGRGSWHLRTVEQVDGRRRVGRRGVHHGRRRLESVAVDLGAGAPVQIQDLEREPGRTDQHVGQGLEADMFDLGLEGLDLGGAIAIDEAVGDVWRIGVGMRFHPSAREKLVVRASQWTFMPSREHQWRRTLRWAMMAFETLASLKRSVKVDSAVDDGTRSARSPSNSSVTST